MSNNKRIEAAQRRRAMMLLLHIGGEMSYADIGRLFSVTPTRVAQIVARAVGDANRMAKRAAVMQSPATQRLMAAGALGAKPVSLARIRDVPP